MLAVTSSEIAEAVQSFITISFMWSFCALALCIGVYKIARLTAREMRENAKRVKGPGRKVVAGIVAGIAGVGATMYGGSKATNRGAFPMTDPNFVWLSDAGSYVTNSAVHIAYTRHVALPDTADIRVARLVGDDPNTEWVDEFVSTVGESQSPFDVPFANATNFSWACYTTYTPGPSVVTNGVLHVNWRADERDGNLNAVPIRTEVVDDGVNLAPPMRGTHAAEIEKITEEENVIE